MWGSNSPWDHDLSWSWMLNRLSHPGAPVALTLNACVRVRKSLQGVQPQTWYLRDDFALTPSSSVRDSVRIIIRVFFWDLLDPTWEFALWMSFSLCSWPCTKCTQLFWLKLLSLTRLEDLSRCLGVLSCKQNDEKGRLVPGLALFYDLGHHAAYGRFTCQL